MTARKLTAEVTRANGEAFATVRGPRGGIKWQGMICRPCYMVALGLDLDADQIKASLADLGFDVEVTR